MKKVYSVFKDYVKSQSIETPDLLEGLLEYSNHYRVIVHAQSGSPKVDLVLRRLALLDATVTYPFLLNLFEYRSEGHVSDPDVVDALSSIESYLFRRWVCKVPTNALTKVFETLHSEILRGIARGGSYAEVLKRILLSKEGSGRFPDDREFMDSFGVRDFYRIGGYRYYLYDRLENGDSAERVNVVDNLQDDTYSIEHIMPQTLSSNWIQDLGDGYEELHSKWVNSMANLTLTTYNSNYSNRRFAEKRDMENGFKESGFRINRFVCQQEKWGEAELVERDRLMREKFLSLWPSITSEFEWGSEPHEEHSLDDDFDFTGRKIAAYTFKGSRFTARTWVDMICNVFSLVYEQNPAAFFKFIPEGSEYPGRYFSQKGGDYWFRVGDGVYYWPGNSTSSKIRALKVIFEAAAIDASELSFELYGERGAGQGDSNDPELD